MQDRWNDQYRSWLADAEWLVDSWCRPESMPRLPTPRVHRWESSDGHDAHHVAIWTGRGIDPAWYPWLHAWVGAACVAQQGAWAFQRSPFRQIFCDFFNAPGTPSMMNLVFVTPSRMPSGEWKSRGRTPILERVAHTSVVNTRVTHDEAFHLRDLTINFGFTPDSLAWSYRMKSSHLLVTNVAQRLIRPFAVNLNRLYWLDEAEDSHLDAFFAGWIPTVFEARTQIRGIWRTHAPMIHLLRLDRFGMVNLLLLETSRDSGEIADVRWAHQTFESIVKHDPYFGAALRETLYKAKELVRP